MQFTKGARNHVIARGHLPGNPPCLTRCIMFGLRPVFIHRNIFASLLSFADHIRETEHAIPFDVKDQETALNAAVMRMAFHFVEMFATWSFVAERSDLLSYEENREDWEGAARRMLEHTGIPVDRSRLKAAVETAQRLTESDPAMVRYRKGGVRDTAMLGPDLKHRVRKLYEIFPDADFSPIDPDIDSLAA